MNGKLQKSIQKENVTERKIRQLADLLALDPNADGKLPVYEMEDLLGAAYAVFDLDANGVLSPKETKRLRNAVRSAFKQKQERQRAAACLLSEDAPDAEVILVNAFESGSISTVSVAGPDRQTSISSLKIEPGETPLHIVAEPCFKYFTDPESGGARIAKSVIEKKLKRPVRVLISGYRLPGVNIPSGELAPNYVLTGGSRLMDPGAREPL